MNGVNSYNANFFSFYFKTKADLSWHLADGQKRQTLQKDVDRMSFLG